MTVRAVLLDARRLGRAVLHYRRGQAVAYCAADGLDPGAAAALTVLASRAADAAAALPGGNAVTSVRVTAVPHRDVPGAVHPGICFMRAGEVTVAACENLLSPAMAAILGQLAAALIRHLSGTASQAGTAARPGA